MNNFKGGGFKKGGNKFGNKSKFGGRDDNRSGGGNKFGGGSDRRDRSSGSSEQFKATCSECHKSCEVPFKPSGDKPVYCSDCFGRKLANNEGRGEKQEQHGGRNSKPDYNKAPREQRSPRHNANERKNDATLADMKRQLVTVEEKLNRILEIINPPMPSTKVALVVDADAPKKVRKPKKAPVVKPQPKKAPRKATTKKTPKIPAVKISKVKVSAKPVPKKVVVKKPVAKKVVKKVTKTAAKKPTAKKTAKK